MSHSPGGMRDFGARASAPTDVTPADGDTYYDTTIDEHMTYESGRAKWLSVVVIPVFFGFAGNTNANTYFQGPGAISYSATSGFCAPWAGTVVGLNYDRTDVDAETFAVTAAGVEIATLASAALKGYSMALNGDFAQNAIIGVKNATASANNIANGRGWAFLRYRR